MNNIAGYRKMLGMTQAEMAKRMNISEGTYRGKEKGYFAFKLDEMNIFFNLMKALKPEISVEEIFFSQLPTKSEESEIRKGEY